MPRQSRLTSLTVIALSLVTLPLGCGTDDGIGKRYTVSGKVNFKGEPLKKGKINFIPDDVKDHPGGGDIEDGQITNVGTMSPGDGLLPGKYKVTITAVEDIDYGGVTQKYKAAPDPVTISKRSRKPRSSSQASTPTPSTRG